MGQLSVYNINFKGKLVYSCLPASDPNAVTFEKHNAEPYIIHGVTFNKVHFEVESVSECGLVPNTDKKHRAYF